MLEYVPVAWSAEGIPASPSIPAPLVERCVGQGTRQSEVEIE